MVALAVRPDEVSLAGFCDNGKIASHYQYGWEAQIIFNGNSARRAP